VAGVEIAERLAADLALARRHRRQRAGARCRRRAHRGAARTGRTVAVMASGADRVYPAQHEELAREIARRGAVVSEYGPGTAPLPFRFPQRNRVISGLADAVIVVEASERSGSLITAACALEQGRDVMAVPGSVLGGRTVAGTPSSATGQRLWKVRTIS
jgi:DNA processing protein